MERTASTKIRSSFREREITTPSVFYAEQTYDECIARVIVPKAVKRGKVFGDVFEINYREQAANVAQNSVAPDHDRLTFADGFVLEAPCHSSFA